jgi:hypothetical protein
MPRRFTEPIKGHYIVPQIALRKIKSTISPWKLSISVLTVRKRREVLEMGFSGSLLILRKYRTLKKFRISFTPRFLSGWLCQISVKE